MTIHEELEKLRKENAELREHHSHLITRAFDLMEGTLKAAEQFKSGIDATLCRYRTELDFRVTIAKLTEERDRIHRELERAKSALKRKRRAK